MDGSIGYRPFFLMVFSFLFICSAGAATAPDVYVRIGRAVPKIKIDGLDLKRELLYGNNERLKQYQGSKSVLFNCQNISSNILRKGQPIKLASLSSPTGLVSWGDNRYRGELVVQTTPGKKACDVVNVLNLEHYISSLLAKEMHSSWPKEALKAQAVAARTYAIYKMDRSNPSQGYQLINSEVNQVNGTFFDETITTYKAAKETEGEILIAPSGRITPIFYHAKCGEITLTPDKVWGNKVEGYRSVKTNFSHNSDDKKWKNDVSLSSFENEIKSILKNTNMASYNKWSKHRGKIRIVADRGDKNILRVYRGSDIFMIGKPAIRKHIGRKIIPSNYFEVNHSKDKILFEGKGNGHGVGMCQYGALELAERGYDYKHILKYFFPGHELVSIDKTI